MYRQNNAEKTTRIKTPNARGKLHCEVATEGVMNSSQASCESRRLTILYRFAVSSQFQSPDSWLSALLYGAKRPISVVTNADGNVSNGPKRTFVSLRASDRLRRRFATES